MTQNVFLKSRRQVSTEQLAHRDRPFSKEVLKDQITSVSAALNGGLATALQSAHAGKSVYSPESMSFDDINNIGSAMDEVSSVIGQFFSPEEAKLGTDGRLASKEYHFGRADFVGNAVRLAAALGTNPKGVLSRTLSVESARAQPRTTVIDVPPGVGDFFLTMPDDIRASMEAYDERENKDAIAFSIVWNANFRQSPWAEAFYPSILLTPDQLGITFTVPVVEVQPELRRDVSGEATDFRRRNVVRALVDPSILEDNVTDVIPVVRAQSAAVFPADALIGSTQVEVGGESVPTKPLLFGKEIGLLSVSQTDALLATGAADTSDQLDPAIRLRNVYLQVGAKAIKLNVHGLNGTTFNYSPQDEYRKMLINTTFKTLLLNKDTKAVDGSAVAGLEPLAANDLQVRIQVDVNGYANLDSGNARLTTAGVTVLSVTDADGVKLAAGNASYDTIVTALEAATTKLVAYDLEARRTNSNLRQRGQLLNTNYFTQIHAVPLRAPITVKRPQNQGEQNDGSDIATLLQTTYARASNAAVSEFFRHAQFLSSFVGSLDDLEGANPDTLGVARYYVRPFYVEESLPVDQVVQIGSTAEKSRAVMEAICYALRDQVYRGYVGSEFKVGSDALRGPTSEPPTVIIGVPPYLRNYLQIFGDVRIFGENFPYRIVESWHPLHKDKIVWSFGYFDGTDGQANPLHFGTLAIRPEITSVLSLPRNGGYSKELTVVPSYLHISNLPIVGILHVTGLEALAAAAIATPVKIIGAIDFNDVTAP